VITFYILDNRFFVYVLDSFLLNNAFINVCVVVVFSEK